MCGIIGVTGLADRLSVVIDGLRALEYRGYDSAGVALVDRSGEVWRRRAAERARSIDKLTAMVAEAPSSLGAAIGHTRWATHGAPTEQNAHPHLDCSRSIALVHNGIIENHRELAGALAAEGHVLASQTDSEVLVHLVEAEMGAGAPPAEALRRCLHKIRGDFAVALVFASAPDTLVAARRTSPLIIGRTPQGGIVASDIAAALATTRELYQLGDDEVAEVRPDGLQVMDATGDGVDLRPLVVTWDIEAARKGGHPDFMSKEMAEQPVAVAETLLGRVEPSGHIELEELALAAAELREIDRVVLVGSGSSYHACLAARHAVESLAKLPAEADIASEFRYRDAALSATTLVIAVSQSGETVDTLHALREARRRGARVIALCNVVDSVMAREADGVLYTRAGPEIGVASTKCHLVQHALLDVFAAYLAQVKGRLDAAQSRRLAGAFASLPQAVTATLARSDAFAEVARAFARARDFYFLGRGRGFTVAAEGALKLKELAYVRAEAYPAGEMKHGPISLIEPGSIVVVIANRSPVWEKVMANVEEMRARGATLIGVVEVEDDESARRFDATLAVEPVLDLLSPIVGVLPLQRIAYEIARARGNDVDRPRNLAKVVTVE